MRYDLFAAAYRSGGSSAVATVLVVYLLLMVACVALLGLAVYLFMWLIGVPVAYWKACLLGITLNFIVQLLRVRR